MSNPLQVPGISFGSLPNKNSNGTIDDLKYGITVDTSGNLIFKDAYVSEYLNKKYVSLAEIYSKNNAISYKDGKVYFNDSSLGKEYSLNEIIESLFDANKNPVAGSLWWANRVEIDHKNVSNIPKTNNVNDLLNIYWSVDKYISDLTGITSCDVVKPLSFYEKTVNPETGEWVWHDVLGLDMVLPPITDSNKICFINAKLSYSQKNGKEPIIFRLYDDTAKVELTRVAVIQNGQDYVNYTVPLTYIGPITYSDINGQLNCTDKESVDCGCIDTRCVTDPNCINPNVTYINNKFDIGSHIIKVQFHISNFHSDYWDRYFGVDIDNKVASVSTIDTTIYDISQTNKNIQKHGTVTFNKVNKVNVVFDTALTTNKYSISLSCNKNINVWFSDKSSNGFTINSEVTFQGYVDWTLLIS